MRFSFLALTVFFIAPSAFAMDGVNLDSGDAFTVDDTTAFNVGDTVAIYDADGNELDLQVQAVKDAGDSWDVDGIDPDTKETTSLEFTKVVAQP
jgi:uncharacterized protein YxjI